MTKDEALKMALEWFEKDGEPDHHPVITAIKEALAQPEQEPVAWVSTTELLVMRGNALGGAKEWRISLGLVKQDGDVGLYTTPPQRKPLTDKEIMNIAQVSCIGISPREDTLNFAKVIEAVHGIKGEA